jgi:FMN phosphatase YigB (HAD superfamily)
MKLIIFDLDNTLLDTTGQLDIILEGDINSIVPFPKTISVLETIQKAGIPMALVTFGVQERQLKKIEVLNIGHFFDDITICEYPEEKQAAFEKLLEKYSSIDKKDIYIVGDRIDVEIMFGNMLGCTTVQMCFGKYVDLKPENEFQIPKYKIHTIEEICQFV